MSEINRVNHAEKVCFQILTNERNDILNKCYELTILISTLVIWQSMLVWKEVETFWQLLIAVVETNVRRLFVTVVNYLISHFTMLSDWRVSILQFSWSIWFFPAYGRASEV